MKTNNLARVQRVVNAMTADGGTPMDEGLALGLRELLQNGRMVEVKGLLSHVTV